MNALNRYGPLAGRILIALIFLMAIINTAALKISSSSAGRGFVFVQ